MRDIGGILFTDEASDMLDVMVEISEEGAAAGMSDAQIAAACRRYLTLVLTQASITVH
jgi:hypothetical protein